MLNSKCQNRSFTAYVLISEVMYWYRLRIVLDRLIALCFYMLGLCCDIRYLVVVDFVVKFYLLTTLMASASTSLCILCE